MVGAAHFDHHPKTESGKLCSFVVIDMTQRIFLIFYDPVKRRQALLGSNLPRDNRMQVALNTAPGGGSLNKSAVSFIPNIVQAFLPMPLKTQYDRSAQRNQQN